jgi:hypothetical protein
MKNLHRLSVIAIAGVGAVLLCGCSRQPDPRVSTLDVRISQLQRNVSSLSNDLASTDVVLADFLRRKSGIGPRLEWVETNMVAIVDQAETESARKKIELDGKIAPGTGMRYSITNAPGALDPATGLPW